MGEARSERPLSVTVPAIGSMIIGGLGWLLAARFVAMSVLLAGRNGGPDTQGFVVMAAALVAAAIVAAGFVYAGIHTLRGSSSGRLLLVALLGLSAVVGLAAFFLLPLFLMGVLAIAAIVALMLPESRAWFAPPAPPVPPTETA